ncbi:hypothetical protein GC170_17850 [bacterium]|nr:hypothetical protein [bacterium]
MVTNEEIVASYADDAMRAIESSCRIDEFEGIFGNPNAWLLQTPFDASNSGFEPGMIARIVKLGFSPGTEFTYVIDSVTSSGFVLKIAGHTTNVGRGPGSIFGTDTVKVKILDMKPVLERAENTVESRFGSYRSEDSGIMEMKSEVIKRLAILRASNDSEFLKKFMGNEELSVDRYETGILDRLGSDLLHRSTRTQDGASNWPRVRR